MKKIIRGDLKCNPNEDYSNVDEITGSLDCRGYTGTFDKLTTVGGSLDCEGYTGTFDKLTTVGGSLYCRGYTGTFDKLTTVGGSLYCEGYTGTFDKLTTVGGYLYCEGADTKASFPKLTEQNAGNAKAVRLVKRSFKRKGFLFADGILTEIIETKQTANIKIHKVRIVGKTEISYCLEVNGTFSHGDTIKEARESLIYKVGKRDKSAYQRWTLKTKITRKQAIESYRVITGACEAGVRHFVESKGKETHKNKYTVQEVIDLTKGQYGNAEYAKYFRR